MAQYLLSTVSKKGQGRGAWVSGTAYVMVPGSREKSQELRREMQPSSTSSPAVIYSSQAPFPIAHLASVQWINSQMNMSSSP